MPLITEIAKQRKYYNVNHRRIAYCVINSVINVDVIVDRLVQHKFHRKRTWTGTNSIMNKYIANVNLTANKLELENYRFVRQNIPRD